MCSRQLNVIALVENLELVVPNRLPVRLLRNSSEQQQPKSASPQLDAHVASTKPDDAKEEQQHQQKEEEVEGSSRDEEAPSDEKQQQQQQQPRTTRCRRTRKRKRADAVQVRRRNPTRSTTLAATTAAAAAEARKQIPRLGSVKRRARTGPRVTATTDAAVCSEVNQPQQHEVRWRQWPVHGMHERPVYHPQFGLAAEYNGRLFASFDGEGYREVVDLEVVRVDPRLESPPDGQTARAPREPLPLSQPQPPTHVDERLALVNRVTTQNQQQQQQQQQHLRALEQLRGLERLRRLGLQQLAGAKQPIRADSPKLQTDPRPALPPLPLCDVQAFKNNANGKLFFVKASNRSSTTVSTPSTAAESVGVSATCNSVEPSRGLQSRRAACYQPSITVELSSRQPTELTCSRGLAAFNFTANHASQLQGQVLDLSRKQTAKPCHQNYNKLDLINVDQAAAASRVGSAISLVGYFQNFGADGSIDVLEESKNLCS